MALLVGVSVTTVSDALNDKGRLSSETRERVKEAARRLGYRPSAAARHLVRGRNGLIALGVSASPNVNFALAQFDYFLDLVNAAAACAFDEGYGIVLMPPLSEAIPAWSRITIDGAIVVDPTVDDPALALLRASGLPFVITGRDPAEGSNDYTVDNEHVHATTQMLNHLYRQGARNIAVMSRPRNTSYAIDVWTTYREWARSKDMSPRWIEVAGGLTEGVGYDATYDLLRSPDPPDAIYTTLDTLALGALLAARHLRKAVPQELLIATSTDSRAAPAANPPLTAVGLNPAEIGRQATRMLMDLIDGKEIGHKHVWVPVTLNARKSTLRDRRRSQSAGLRP